MEFTANWPFHTRPDIIDVHGLQTAYRRKGDGSFVVYLHGNGLVRRWLPFYEELAKSCDLLVPEHPGFGDTPMPDWLDNFDDMVLHYAALFDIIGADKVHLIGHSMGGWIAAEIAAFYPERLKSLQLIAPAGLKDAFLNDIFRQTPEEGFERVHNGKGEKYPDYNQSGDPTEALISGYVQSTTMARLAWQPRHDAKLPRRLGRVKAPTQIILAQEDRIINNAVAAKYADYIPNSRVVTIENPDDPTTHLPFIQAPMALARLLSDFIVKAEQGASQ